MREIKFRAWDKLHKRMRTLQALHWQPDYVAFENGDMTETDGAVVMQYTGLKDKNGREIYEGDILRTDDGLGRLSTEVITWEESGFWIRTHKGNLHLPAQPYREVIGNIYENPDLMKTAV